MLGRVDEGNAVRFERVDEIRVGATTKAQVLEWFGAPDDASDPRVRNTSTFTLEEPVITNFTFFTYTRTTEKDDRLSILFDPRGVVSSFGLRRGTEELGGF